MPFQYAPYHSPFTNSIAETMLRKGDAAAHASEQTGQIYGQAIANVGQAVNGAVQQATDPQRQMARQQVSDLSALDKAFSQPGGRDAILASLPGHLRGQVAASFASADENAAKVQEANFSLEKATTEYVTGLAEKIKAHGYEPVAAQLALSHARQTFKSNPSLVQQVSQLEAQIQQPGASPDTIKALIDPIIAAKDAQEKPVILPSTPRGGAPAQLIKPGSGAVVATGQAAPPPEPTAAGNEAAIRALYAKRASGQPLTPAETASIDGYEAEKSANDAPVTVKTMVNGKPVEKVMKRSEALAQGIFDSQPPASTVVNAALVPSGDALSMAARRYLATGELPAMGMGQAGAAARVAVMNEAAKLDPQASLAQNAATFKADSANLKNLQTTEGTLAAFENTAGKNLDQFLSLAAKIPDTGVPWINQPLRTVNAQGLGSANQAAFNAARDVALREIARVTNDPKLSGVLSDSARHEVSQLSPQSATFAQIKAVATVLKQDMANVHSSLTQQIATAKGAIDQHPGGPSGDVRQKAATVLSGAGKASDAAAVDAFLKNNPGFK